MDANKTLTDVSGALELSVAQLSAIEKGEKRPHEELVLLLASYFKLPKTQTQQLLYLAGYQSKNRAKTKAKKADFKAFLEEVLGKHIADSRHFLIAFSEQVQEKAIYTNETAVNVSQNGVIIKFSQSTFVDKGSISMPVAKVGMSLEHAQQLNKILTKALRKVGRPDQVSDESPQPDDLDN